MYPFPLATFLYLQKILIGKITEVTAQHLTGTHIFDADTNLLILKDAKLSNGLLLKSTSLKILGNCEITAGNTSSSDSIALHFNNTNTSSLICEGTLILNGGKASSSFNSYGIYATGALLVSGAGKIYATAETGKHSFGIFCAQNISISNCYLNASAAKSTSLSYGIYSQYGNITITNACGFISGDDSALNKKPDINVSMTGSYTDKEISFGNIPEEKEKDTISINENMQTFTYGTENIRFSVYDTSLTDFTVEYFVENNWTAIPPTNVGAYDVKITRPGDNLYLPFDKTILGGLVIERAIVKVPENAGQTDYTGHLLKSNLTDAELYSVTENNGGIFAGRYDVVLTLNNTDNYKWESTDEPSITIDFFIIGSDQIVSDVSIADWTYNEKPGTPIATSSYGEVQYRYLTLDNEPLSERPSDVGVYQVQAYVILNNDNYKTVYSQPKIFTIHKAKVAVPENAGQKVYTGKLLTSDIFDTDLYIVTKNEGGINVGEYDVVLTLREPDNYRWEKNTESSVTIKLIIVAMENEVSDVSISDWTYGDKPSTPQAFSRLGTVEFRYYTNEGEMLAACPEKAGTYKIKAYIPANGNNFGAVYSKNFTTFTIHKRAITFPENAGSKTYNAHLQTSDITETKYYSVTQYGGIETGSYPVILSLKDPLNCFWAKGDESADKEISFEIEKFAYNSIGSFYVRDYVYGEAFETLTAYSAFGEIRFTYSQEKDGNYTETIPKKAGTWYVKAKVSNTKNYNGCEAIRSFVIEKAIVDIPENAGFVSYNGEKQKSSLTENDFYEVFGNRGRDAVGTYEIMLRLKNKDDTCWEDHSTDDKTLLFTILATKNKISNVEITDWTYGEPASKPSATAQFGEIKYEFYTIEGELLGKCPEDVGFYQVRACVENGNGKEYSDDFTTFQIKKVFVPMPQGDKSAYFYTGELQHYQIKKSEYYSVINDRRTQTGTQTVSVMLADKTNYAWENGTTDDLFFDFTIRNTPVFAAKDNSAIGGYFVVALTGAALGVVGTVSWNRFSKKYFQKRKNNK